MNEIKEYNSENLNWLKLWLGDMKSQGHPKFFEVLVDGMRVIYKTDNLERFDEYLNWINETTKSMRVLVYNTRNSHRSQIFEFRTENYIEGVSEKLYPTRQRRLSEDEIDKRVLEAIEEKRKNQAFAELQKQNKDLTKRLLDAEEYIRKQESELNEYKSKKSGFDFESLLATLALKFGDNPAVKEQLKGFESAFKSQKTEETNSGEAEGSVTFRKKPQPTETKVEQTEATNTSTVIPVESKDDTINFHVPNMKLDEAMCFKIYEMLYFLSQNTELIDTFYDLMKGERMNKL